MMRSVALLFACVACGCAHTPSSAARPALWEWSEDHGDKPGVGLRLLVGDEQISGTFCLFPRDNPAVPAVAPRVVPLADVHRAGRVVTFLVILDAGTGQYRERMTVTLEADLVGKIGDGVRATLRDTDRFASPTRVVLVRRE